MHTKTIFNILYCLLAISVAHAQQVKDFSFSSIPEDLLTNANAVLRHEVSDINLRSYKDMRVKYERAVTILNEKGSKSVGAYLHFDEGVQVEKLQAIIYNSSGASIKTIKKRDFVNVSAVSGGTMYSDSRIYYLDYTTPEYPYTVFFTYEYRTSNTAFLKKWTPLEAYYMSTQRSVYSIGWVEGVDIRFKENNFENYLIENYSKGNQLKYVLENCHALQSEYLSPDFGSMTPSLLVAASKFHLEGVDGYATNWEEFGAWFNAALLDNTNDLSVDTKNEIRRLVADEKIPIEKAKIVHQYVQDKTRYVSVQIGIGGWKPMLASEVDKLGYGDCKALTNYTRSLLDAVGVDSYFTIIYGDTNNKKNLEEEFAFLQGNHAILAIKDGEDVVWVDCTSQRDPFGFIAGFTDDRRALLVKPNGGELIRTKKYIVEDNHQYMKVDCYIDETGSTSGSVAISSKGMQYNNRFRMETYSSKKVEEYYKKNTWSYINNLDISNVEFSNDRDQVVFNERIDFQIVNYGTLSGARILLAPNILNRVSYVPERYPDRQRDLKIQRGFVDEDEYSMVIPEGYDLEVGLDSVYINERFGSYSASMEFDRNRISYRRRFVIREGTYAKEEYANYRKFIKKVKKFDVSKIVLIKK